jgi:flagellar motility protein MotE (MotC chaperone)
VRLMNDQHGKVPLGLIIVAVIIIGAAAFAALAFTGVVVVPGITPEEKPVEKKAKVEITPEQQMQDQMRQLLNERVANQNKISELEERVELKDERIDSLTAEVARLQDLVKLTDDTAVKDVAAVYERMAPEDAVQILSKFDPEKSVLILKAMDEKRAADVLAGMDPDLAARITELMAGFKKPFTPPSAAPAPATQPAAPGGAQPTSPGTTGPTSPTGPAATGG